MKNSVTYIEVRGCVVANAAKNFGDKSGTTLHAQEHDYYNAIAT